jgi:hypothetical protein
VDVVFGLSQQTRHGLSLCAYATQCAEGAERHALEQTARLGGFKRNGGNKGFHDDFLSRLEVNELTTRQLTTKKGKMRAARALVLFALRPQETPYWAGQKESRTGVPAFR